MGYRVSRRAANDLEGIWDYIAEESDRPEAATRVVEAVTLLSRSLPTIPLPAVREIRISVPGSEASQWSGTSSSIGWSAKTY